MCIRDSKVIMKDMATPTIRGMAKLEQLARKIMKTKGVMYELGRAKLVQKKKQFERDYYVETELGRSGLGGNKVDMGLMMEINGSTEGFTWSGDTSCCGEIWRTLDMEDCKAAGYQRVVGGKPEQLDEMDVFLQDHFKSQVKRWYGSHSEDSCSVTQDTDASSTGMAELKALNQGVTSATGIFDSFVGMMQRCGSGKMRHLEGRGRRLLEVRRAELEVVKIGAG